MKVKGDKVYFEADDYKLAKELLNKHVVIHADGTGPFGEDEGAHVSGMDVDYADNIENYEGLEGKGWDELDDEEKEWFDGEDDFEQLNPYWADGIVCIDKDLGQSGVNWCDWEMIYADLWVKKEDYDKVNNVHTVHYDMEVESTKHRSTGMLLSEAKEILKNNGYYLVEDTDDPDDLEIQKDEYIRNRRRADRFGRGNHSTYDWRTKEGKARHDLSTADPDGWYDGADHYHSKTERNLHDKIWNAKSYNLINKLKEAGLKAAPHDYYDACVKNGKHTWYISVDSENDSILVQDEDNEEYTVNSFDELINLIG